MKLEEALKCYNPDWCKCHVGWDDKIHFVGTRCIYQIFWPRKRISRTILYGLNSLAIFII